jgi:hypothetical protein
MMLSPTLNRFAALFLLATCALLASCKKEREQDNTPVSTPQSTVIPAATSPSTPVKLTEPVSKKVEALTGSHTRAVWSHHVGTGSPDPFCSGSSHQLQCLDTRDGQGVRILIAKKSNYSRPLITPDGSQILYTRKIVTRSKKNEAHKEFDMTIMATDWQGSTPREIATGYALDVWKDPASGLLWVYAAHDVPPTHRTSWAAKKLIRFRLDEPSKVETVWDQTEISPDNTQLSADGKRASGQTPWPHGGQYLFDASGNSFLPSVTGCWSGMAPDNSYLSWMLDGNHRMVTLFTAAPQKKTWILKFNQLAGLEKGEIYHPRWTNHARFIALTGPYIAERAGSGSIISKGGRSAEVVIAKLNATATGFEGSVTLTQDKNTDAYPDVWIAGGETATLGDFPQGLAKAESTQTWPAEGSKLAFLWEALGQPNQIRLADGKNLQCHVEPEGASLFGHRLDMQLFTGSFTPTALAQAHLVKTLPAAKAWTLEASLLPSSLPHPEAPLTGPLLSLPGWKLELAAGQVSVNGTTFDHPALVLPTHFALRRDGTALTLFLNGKALPSQAIAALPDAASTQFGGGTLAVGLQGLALHTTALDEAAIQSSHQHWQARFSESLKKSPPRVRLRAKLAETTGVPTAESLDAYTRAMIAYVYDVEEVLEGVYEEKQILVCHWALMDRKAIPDFPRKLGDSFELLVEPLDLEKHHPELEGQRVLDDTTAFDLEKWYDINPPRL